MLLRFIWFLRVFLMAIIYSDMRDFSGMMRAVKKIKKCGFEASAVMDIGANTGTWSVAMNALFPKSRFYMIEGNDDNIPALKAVGFPFEIAMVADASRNATFYRVKQGKGFSNTGSSLFKENTDAYDRDNYETVRTSITTIDEIIMKKKIGPFQLMKIDVQGSEISALRGGLTALNDVEILITECPIMNYNEGDPSFLDLHIFMNEVGFTVFDIFDESRNRKTSTLLQVDVMWVKKTSKLWRKSCTGFPIPLSFRNVTSIAPTNN